MNEALEWDVCCQCGKDITVKLNGTLRAHGQPARRCPGSGLPGQEWLAFKADLAAHQAGAS